jgi:hypothetical protein
MLYRTSGKLLGSVSLKNRSISRDPLVYHDFVWCRTVSLPGPAAPPLPELTLSTRYWMRQLHRLYHTASQSSIHISAFLQLISYSNNTLIYIFHFNFINAYSLCERTLTRCRFIEFPEEPVAKDENCFLRSLSTQQEDESQNNVPRDKAVQYLRNDWEKFCPFVAFYI